MAVFDAPPFWGPPTSYLNFCEEDYVVTRYIAEFINTLTSLVYITYGIYGLRKVHRKSRAGLRSVPYWGLIGVGTCSAAYHLSLKYHTQMSDELSMHLTTTPIVHRILTFDTSPRYTMTMGAALSLAFAAVIVIHASMDEFAVHAVSFAISLYVISSGTRRLLSRQVQNPVYKKKVNGMIRFAAFSFAMGYLLWLVDCWACDVLTKIRLAVGFPWAFLFELHAWWHILTGIGAYIFIGLIDYVTSEDVQTDPAELFAWPAPWAAQSIFAGRQQNKQN